MAQSGKAHNEREEASTAEEGAKRPALWVVEGGKTAEIRIPAESSEPEPEADDRSEVGSAQIEGIAVDDAAIEPTSEAAIVGVAPPMLVVQPAGAPTAPASGGKLVQRMAIGLLALVVVAAGAFVGLRLVSHSNGFRTVSRDQGQLLEDNQDAAKDLKVANLQEYSKQVNEDLKTAQDLRDDARSLDGADQRAAAEKLSDAQIAYFEELIAVADTPRAKVTDATFDDLKRAHEDLQDAVKESSAADSQAFEHSVQVSYAPLEKVQRQNLAEFQLARKKREKERAAIIKQNRATAQLAAKVRTYSSKFKSQVSAYRATRESTSAWSASISSKLWILVTASDFARLDAEIANRHAIRGRMSGMAAVAPQELRAPSQGIISVLDRAIAGTESARSGLMSTIDPYSPYAYVTDTPAWQQFLNASSIIDKQLPSSEKTFDSAVRKMLKSLKQRKVPPPITE